MQPHGRILVEPVKDPRAVGVVEIPTPAFQQPVHFRDDFLRRTPQRPVVELLPQLVPQLTLAFGVGFNMRIVSSALASPPTHAKPKELEPFRSHIERPGFRLIQREAVRGQPPFQPHL